MTVALTHDQRMQNGRTVIYNKIITNDGHGYHLDTGNFVAPEDGTYIIHYHALSEDDKASKNIDFHDINPLAEARGDI